MHLVAPDVTHRAVLTGLFGEADGLVGLAFPGLASDDDYHWSGQNTDSSPSWTGGCGGAVGLLNAMAMARGNMSMSRSFCFYLTESPGLEGSELTFGEPDGRRHDAPFRYHPLIAQRDYWAVRLQDILVGGRSLGVCPPAPGHCKLVVDTGTSFLTAPSQQVLLFDHVQRPRAISGGRLESIHSRGVQALHQRTS